MLAPQPACLVIADISGYTGYLAGVELDHAQDILADLVDTVVDGLRPTLRLAKLEGDAAFAYVIAESIDPSLLQDTIEATYFAFRRRMRDIKQASRCECNACILIPSLDLKFVVHHGLVIVQQVAGREELVGRDVILVHRLLKNGVEEKTGAHAYALYTQACIDAMGIDPVRQGMVPHAEAVDIIGQVDGWVRDLDKAWRDELARQRVRVTPDEAAAVMSFETRAPQPLVWEYVTSPARRPQWSAGTDEVREQAADGRRGIGTMNHCVHGRDAIIEEILDWRPYDYWTTRSTMPIPDVPKLIITEAFTPTERGTRVDIVIARPEAADRNAFDRLTPIVRPLFERSIETLRVLLEEASAATDIALAHEPPKPVSAARFATEPLTAGPVTPAPLPAGPTVDLHKVRSSEE
jgi:uncharacterized protein YndB with AHSA1/START domain